MSSSYRILAIGYYDGATEGFLVRPIDGTVSYFRLIAWDRGQDQRLFVVSEVEVKELSRVEDLLKAAGQTPKHHTWIPEWRFSGDHDAAEGDEIVKRCRNKLGGGRFALGSQPDTSEMLCPVTQDLRHGVVEVIRKNTAGNLGEWLKILPEYGGR